MLQWLINRVTYLANRISTLWNAAWNWAVSKAQDAYNRAVAWASSQVSSVRAITWKLFYQVRDYATNLRNGLVSTILYWYNRAVGAAQAIVKGARDLARSLYDQARAFVITTRDFIVAGWNLAFNWVKDRLVKLWNDTVAFGTVIYDRAVATIQTTVKGVTDVWAALIDRGKVEIEELKAKIGINSPDQQSTLLQFLQNPASFIYAYLWNMFLEFLEWSLAYAMGTTLQELPSLPNWFGEGSGGAVLTGSGPPPGASGLAPPLDHVYVSGYIFRKGHPGIDLGLVRGARVYAMHSGTVQISAWSTIGYGFYVTIHSDEWWTLYAHLDALNVRPGQRVGQGDVIGLGNSTGNSTGDHLHLEIKHRGTYIDPATVL